LSYLALGRGAVEPSDAAAAPTVARQPEIDSIPFRRGREGNRLLILGAMAPRDSRSPNAVETTPAVAGQMNRPRSNRLA
jgi:hypothetical protein